MFKLLSSKLKQKIQSDLTQTENIKHAGNRLDLSGDLKSGSDVLNTYGGESNAGQSYLCKKDQTSGKATGDYFMESGFGGFSY
jgi:hypothetical protein